MPLPFYSYDRDLAAFGISDHAQWEDGEQEEHELTNPIHPIWQQDNIRVGSVDLLDENALMEFIVEDSPDIRIPDLVYERLKPAFQLASLMLEASQPFFAKVHCARITPLPQARLTERFYHFMWSELETSYKVMLRNDAPTNTWERLKTNHGMTCSVDDETEEYRRTRNPLDMNRYFVTDIEPRFWEFFRAGQGDDRLSRASAQDRNRYCFDLAVLLLHELAHTVFETAQRAEKSSMITASRRSNSVSSGRDTS